MARFSVNSTLKFLYLSICLLPLVHSLSSIAISETGNQTLVCAIAQSNTGSFLNCTSFPQGIQIPLNPPWKSISGIVGGNGSICALSSSYSSSTSIMGCWRFSQIVEKMTYKRLYRGPILKDLDSGNSKICGLFNCSNSLQCWPREGSNYDFTSSLAVGENFVCGLSNSGQVQCLGSDTNVTDLVPKGNFSQIEANLGHACAISFNGSLVCWGKIVGKVPKGEFTSLALGENRGCALKPNGTVSCWGEKGFDLPLSLREESFIALESKRSIFCGVTLMNYSLVCWGNDYFDSNLLVFNDVVPGPCRAREDCPCGDLLPNYGKYCGQGLVICQPCVKVPNTISASEPPPPLTVAPEPSFPVANRNRKWDTKTTVLVVVGSVGSLLFLLLLISILFSRYCKIRGSRIHDSGRLEQSDSPPEESPPPHPTPRALEKRLSHLISIGNGCHLEEFSLDLLLKVTANFSEDHKIGNGSFGSVYHATLSDGREVAVKRAETSSSSSYAYATKRGQQDKDTAFLNELEFLSRLNHKNLVRLLGYCEDSNELVLVYEYMSNGTLFDHLHKLPNSPLNSWPARIKVALDAARGIEYLHEFSVPSVIHRDIKSSNILLASNWAAKVSDFGLSLMGPQGEDTHLSLRAAGTMGYMDPEYYRLQLLTTKSDVYSFGVLLLEILSGRKAIHKNENGVPRNVVDYVVPYIVQDEIHRVLDRRVPPPTPFEIEAVAYLGYLAADCVMPEGRDRPTMSEVVSSLDRALEACFAPRELSRSTTDSSA